MFFCFASLLFKNMGLIPFFSKDFDKLYKRETDTIYFNSIFFINYLNNFLFCTPLLGPNPRSALFKTRICGRPTKFLENASFRPVYGI